VLVEVLADAASYDLMATSDVSRTLATERDLPGVLAIRRHGVRTFVELDIPLKAERIPEPVVAAVEALCLGFVRRLLATARSNEAEVGVSVTDDYVGTWVHERDLEYLLVALSTLLNGATVAAPPGGDPESGRQ
jgi:hypothetical protein